MYHILPQSHDNIIGIRVIDEIRSEDYETLLPFVEEMIKEHKSIRLLIDLEEFKGIQFLTVMRNVPLTFKYRNSVEKKAIITDQNWVSTWAQILSPFFQTLVRCFARENYEDAWEWIER